MVAWKEFEKLAEKIFNELNSSARVKHDDKIQGYDTNKPRQIDVSIRWQSDGHDYLTIVQAKDYKTPADINIVGEFLAVINDVRANGGILICNAGFTKDAHVYARNIGISLLNLHDALSVKWSRRLKIPILWNELKPVVNVAGKVYLEAGDVVLTDDPLGPPMTDSDAGHRINPLSTFQRYWNGTTTNRSPHIAHTIESEKPLKLIVQDKDGQIQLRPVKEFVINYVVEQKFWFGSFEPNECRGIIDYLDNGSFTVSHLPTSSLPIKRDKAWTVISNQKIRLKTLGGL